MIAIFVLLTFLFAALGAAALVAAGTILVVARTRAGRNLTAALAVAPTGRRAVRAH